MVSAYQGDLHISPAMEHKYFGQTMFSAHAASSRRHLPFAEVPAFQGRMLLAQVNR
jgi:hypothetical protein